MAEKSEIRIPTDDEVAALDPGVRAEMAAAYLRGREPGRQPLALFTELSRLTVASTVEIVPLRENQDGGPDVWMEQRSADDKWWANKWTLPGAVVLANDVRDEENSLAGPIARLWEDELPGLDRTGELHALPSQFRHDGRGAEVTSQFWTTVASNGEEMKGAFFDVAEMRENEPEGGVLEEGWVTIDRAVEEYEALRAQSNS